MADVEESPASQDENAEISATPELSREVTEEKENATPADEENVEAGISEEAEEEKKDGDEEASPATETENSVEKEEEPKVSTAETENDVDKEEEAKVSATETENDVDKEEEPKVSATETENDVDKEEEPKTSSPDEGIVPTAENEVRENETELEKNDNEDASSAEKQDGEAGEDDEEKKDDIRDGGEASDKEKGEDNEDEINLEAGDADEKESESKKDDDGEKVEAEVERVDDEEAEKVEKDVEGDGEEKHEDADEDKNDDEEKVDEETAELDGAESKDEEEKNEVVEDRECPESPTRVGEKLSREGSPAEEKDDETRDEPSSPPAADSPYLMTSEERQHDVIEEGDEDEELDEDEDTERRPDTIVEEEEEEYVPEFSREALIERYHAAIAERDQHQQQNYQMQHRLADYFRKKRGDEVRPEMDHKQITEQEQRYLKYMANLEDLRQEDAKVRKECKDKIEEQKVLSVERQSLVDEQRNKYLQFKKNVALHAVNTRSGKQIPQKDIDDYLVAEMKKEADVIIARLEYIKQKNRLKKRENELKSREELGEGLHMIDFEQLKMETSVLGEKIEERNEEIMKLRKKMTSTVQDLTHLKEKLQYSLQGNRTEKDELMEVEAYVAKKRDILTRTKQARDALRIDNGRLRAQSGMLGNKNLLLDFEVSLDENVELREALDNLKTYHTELTLEMGKVKRKIDSARQAEY